MGARVAMTMGKTGLKTVAALCCAAILAGCGNDPNGSSLSLDTLKQVFSRAGEASSPPTQAVVAQALAGTQGPLELITREDNQAWSLMLRIEQNGAYDTFGSADRRTVTMKDGIVTATRGLGGDLMSSDVSQIAPLISGRRAGQGTRVMRFLDGEDKTVEIRFACTITPGKSFPVKAGALDTTARQVTETCRAQGRQITNTYLVDAHGRSVSAKQWVSAQNGYFLLQTLRR